MLWKANNKKRRFSHSAAEVANVFIELAQRDSVFLSNMRLQKLVYIAYGYCLAILGRPLFDDEIQAWEYGPVIPDLYHQLKKFGAGEVTEFIPEVGGIPGDGSERQIIENVWQAYSGFSALELSGITHNEGTPWSVAWKEGKPHVAIPNHLIQPHYEKLYREQS